MTEYDYSPEAYEAYIRRQDKIAHWVKNRLDLEITTSTWHNPVRHLFQSLCAWGLTI